MERSSCLKDKFNFFSGTLPKRTYSPNGTSAPRKRKAAYTLTEIVIVMLIISVIVAVTIGVTKAKLDKITSYTYTTAYLTLRDVTRNILGDFSSADDDYMALRSFFSNTFTELLISVDNFSKNLIPSARAASLGHTTLYRCAVGTYVSGYTGANVPPTYVDNWRLLPCENYSGDAYHAWLDGHYAVPTIDSGWVKSKGDLNCTKCKYAPENVIGDYDLCPGKLRGKYNSYDRKTNIVQTKCRHSCKFPEGEDTNDCGSYALDTWQYAKVGIEVYFPKLKKSVKYTDVDLVLDSSLPCGAYLTVSVACKEENLSLGERGGYVGPTCLPDCDEPYDAVKALKRCQEGLEWDNTPGVCEWKPIPNWSTECPSGQEWYNYDYHCGCRDIPEPEPCVQPSLEEQNFNIKCMGQHWNNTPGVCKWERNSNWSIPDNCPEGEVWELWGGMYGDADENSPGCGCVPLICTEPSASEKTSQYCQGLQWNNTPGVCSWENIPDWPPECPDTEEWNYSDTDCHCIPTPKTLPRSGENFCKMFAERTNTKSGTTDCSGSSISSNTTDFKNKTADITLRNGMLLYNVRQNPQAIPALANNKQGGSYAGVDNTNSYGYTVYVDVNGKQGDSKLWEDVYPFYITMSGLVVAGYDKDANPEGSGGDNSDHMQVSVQSEFIDYNGTRKINWLERSVPFQTGACRSGYVGQNTPYCNGITTASTCTAVNANCRIKYISPVKFF